MTFSAGPAPSGYWPETGSQPRITATIRISITPETNSGMAVNERPPSEIVRSTSRPRRTPGDDAPEDADRHQDHERQHSELERAQKRVAHQIADRLAVGERGAEVAAQHVRRPVEVLGDDRAVETVLDPALLHRLLRGEAAEHRSAHVARQELREANTRMLSRTSEISASPNLRSTSAVIRTYSTPTSDRRAAAASRRRPPARLVVC